MADQLKCMDTILQGVYIVGTRGKETYNLMTAAFVTQVSFDPCRIALSVGRTHYTAGLVEEQQYFSISVLAEGQEKTARACGYDSGRDVDKSKRVACKLTEQGLPVIPDAAAYMVCKVERTIDIGDHLLFIAVIEAGEVFDHPPMVYHSTTYF